MLDTTTVSGADAGCEERRGSILPLQLSAYDSSSLILLSILVYRSLVLSRVPPTATSIPSTVLSTYTTDTVAFLDC